MSDKVPCQLFALTWQSSHLSMWLSLNISESVNRTLQVCVSLSQCVISLVDINFFWCLIINNIYYNKFARKANLIISTNLHRSELVLPFELDPLYLKLFFYSKILQQMDTVNNCQATLLANYLVLIWQENLWVAKL